MKRYFSAPAAIAAAALVIAALPAAAQTLATDEPPGKSVTEVTPYVSLGSELASRVGTAIAFRWTRQVSLEAEVGYRHGEMHALSANASLLYDLPQFGRVTPYLAAGGGLEQFGMVREQPGGALVTQPRVALTVNAGGGIKVPVDDNWGFRADARWFNGLGREAPEHWRLYNGVSFRTGGQ
jgi:hypothetical protein